tara:strand:- start:3227 stop:4024 length:798 start_codon:yes stop_codon:yes gene_type:complete
MSFFTDDQNIGGQLKVGNGLVPAVGESLSKINGSAYIEGPMVVGGQLAFPTPYATVCIGPYANSDESPISSLAGLVPGALLPGGNHSKYSLAVDGPTALLGDLDANENVFVGQNVIAQGEVFSRNGGHCLSAKKNFDIPHPTREGYRLRHTCPEGPSNDVYYRGRVINKKEIILPTYWKGLVDWTTITVNLTPIGSHQHVIVKRIDEEKIYLQSNGGMPIDCFYHIFAERSDGERLIPEYEGESPKDYPGNNDEYSVSGYHYDIK